MIIKMSDDDFFYDKDDCSLHYIQSKTSTKIDDILKRRRNKKLKEANDLQNSTFLSFNDSLSNTEYKSNNEKNDDDALINNKSDVYSSKYSIYKSKLSTNNDLDVCSKNDHSIKDKGENDYYSYYTNNNTYEAKSANTFKKNDQNAYDMKSDYALLHKKNDYTMSNKNNEYFLSDRIVTQKYYGHDKDNVVDKENENDTHSPSYSIIKKGRASYSNIETGKNTNIELLYRSPFENLQEHSNHILDDASEYKNEDKTETISMYLNNKLKILKTPSTELLLQKIKSNDDNKDEIFANINKIDINDIDMNKTPSKSYSKSYMEYIKFETAGKMNISELETPLNLKEEDVTNTPFITYYLAGETKNKNNDENIVNDLKDNISTKKDTITTTTTTTANINNGNYNSDNYSNGNYNNNNIETDVYYSDCHLKEIDIPNNNFLKQEEQIIKCSEIKGKYNDNDIASDTSNNKYNKDSTYSKVINSKKYNFVKTEEQYQNMLKEKNDKEDNLTYRNINKKYFSNDVSFMDKNSRNDPLKIMNTKTFKMNFFKEYKSISNESNMYMSNYKNEANSHAFDIPLNTRANLHREKFDASKGNCINADKEKYDKLIDNYRSEPKFSTKIFQEEVNNRNNSLIINSSAAKNITHENNNSCSNNYGDSEGMNKHGTHSSLYKNINIELITKSGLLSNNLKKHKMNLNNCSIDNRDEENYDHVYQSHLSDKEYTNDNSDYVYNPYKMESGLYNKKLVDPTKKVGAADKNYVGDNTLPFHKNNSNDSSSGKNINDNSDNVNYDIGNYSKDQAENAHYPNNFQNHEYNSNKRSHNELNKKKIDKNDLSMNIGGDNDQIFHKNYKSDVISYNKNVDPFNIKSNSLFEKKNIKDSYSTYEKRSNRNHTNEYVKYDNVINTSNLNLDHEISLKKNDLYVCNGNYENNNYIFSKENMHTDCMNKNNKSVYEKNNIVYYIPANNQNDNNLGHVKQDNSEIKENDYDKVSLEEKKFINPLNKNDANKLSETADFGYHKVNDTCELNNERVVQMSNDVSNGRTSGENDKNDDNNYYNISNDYDHCSGENHTLSNQEMNNASELKKNCFDYVKNNLKNMYFNDIKSMMYDPQNSNKQNYEETFNAISKQTENKVFNEFILEQIKSSINSAVEKILNDKHNDILNKLTITTLDYEKNRIDAHNKDDISRIPTNTNEAKIEHSNFENEKKKQS